MFVKQGSSKSLSPIKAKMAEICAEIGMSQSTALNIFAKAFVRAKGIPFAVNLEQTAKFLSRAQMLADADAILDEYADDYKRMTESNLHKMTRDYIG